MTKSANVFALALGGGLLAWTAIQVRPQVGGEFAALDRPIAVQAHGYVGSQTCRSCHPQQYASWYASYHRTMTQVTKPETVVGDFDDVLLQANGVTYRLTRRGDEFWVGSNGWGQSVDGRNRVVMSTGSHHQQIYWLATGMGRTLQVLPFSYILEARRWVPLDAAFLRPHQNDVPPGEWNTNCLRCHTTHSQPRVYGSTFTSVDTHVSEFGIGCEECHGPGAKHAAINHDPIRRYRHHLDERPDSTIVRPDKLSSRRATEVCARCHAVTLRDAEEIAHWNATGLRYRPGDALEATQILMQPGIDWDKIDYLLPSGDDYLDSTFWPDGMVRVTGREYNGVIKSPCFVRGEMSCLSCHLMHPASDDNRPLGVWANDQLKPQMYGNSACTQCHKKYIGDANVILHTHHLPLSSGSNCYNCHMPYTSFGLLKSVRSHEVDSPSTKNAYGDRPNACNLCHLDRTFAWTAKYLREWYEEPEPELDVHQRSIAASVRWVLSGDAGQRALVAWSMGWEEARQASGSQWMAPYLGQLLSDPYAAVRYIAQRSLRTLPHFNDFEYDFLDAKATQGAATQRVLNLWLGTPASERPMKVEVLVGSDGRLMQQLYAPLLRQRNDRTVALAE